MTYKFPPPEWFESGTTSYMVLVVILWAITVGVPGSILACWILKPRSRIVWIIAETFWFLALISNLMLLFSNVPQFLFRDVTSVPAIIAILVLATLPFPAVIAGWQQLLGNRESARGFRDLPTWGFALGILFVAGLLFMPSMGPHIEASRRSRCKNQLKQIGLALQNFHDEHRVLPDCQISEDGVPARSWRVEMLPYLGFKAEFAAYDKTSSWDSALNTEFSKQELKTEGDQLFVCPAVPVAAQMDSSGRWYSDYATLIGADTAFPNGNGRVLGKEFTDGTSYTALVVEACGQQIVWTEPRDVEVSDKNIGINLPGNQPGRSPASWSSYHRSGRSGAHTLMADGSVRFLSEDTDPRILRAITTANGGEKDSNDF